MHCVIELAAACGIGGRRERGGARSAALASSVSLLNAQHPVRGAARNAARFAGHRARRDGDAGRSVLARLLQKEARVRAVRGAARRLTSFQRKLPT